MECMYLTHIKASNNSRIIAIIINNYKLYLTILKVKYKECKLDYY